MGTHFLRHRALARWGTDVLVDIVELELMLLSRDAVKCTSARLLLSNHSKPYVCACLQLTTYDPLVRPLNPLHTIISPT